MSFDPRRLAAHQRHKLSGTVWTIMMYATIPALTNGASIQLRMQISSTFPCAHCSCSTSPPHSRRQHRCCFQAGLVMSSSCSTGQTACLRLQTRWPCRVRIIYLDYKATATVVAPSKREPQVALCSDRNPLVPKWRPVKPVKIVVSLVCPVTVPGEGIYVKSCEVRRLHWAL